MYLYIIAGNCHVELCHLSDVNVAVFVVLFKYFLFSFSATSWASQSTIQVNEDIMYHEPRELQLWGCTSWFEYPTIDWLQLYFGIHFFSSSDCFVFCNTTQAISHLSFFPINLYLFDTVLLIIPCFVGSFQVTGDIVSNYKLHKVIEEHK